MKKIHLIKILATILLLVTIGSCDDFTEVGKPQSQLIGYTVFQEYSTANAAMADVYARMRDGGMVTGLNTGLSSVLGNYADELDFYSTNPPLQQFNNHTVVPSNPLIAGLWNNSYGQIYACNALLKGVEESASLTQEQKDRLKGEALFIRGYLHFYLVNLFGSIPYVTGIEYNANATIGKLSEAVVYEHILADITLAETLLPTTYQGTERVRVNKAVATAFLARVHLYLGHWAEAEAHATSVIANSTYTWEANPANEFLRTSPDVIWSLHPGIAGLNTRDARTFIFTSGPPIRPAMATGLHSAFETGDLRKTNWTRTISNASGSWAHAFKYKKTTNTGTSQEYTILFRLSEQYLIRAEARAHLGDISGAQTDINKVRSRGGLANTTATTATELLEAVMQERRVELFLEQGHRWFDLKRTGRANAVMSAIRPLWQPTQLLLPLPESELLLNPNLLPQNPGY